MTSPAIRVGNTTSFSADVSSGTYYVRVRAINDYGESDPTTDLVLVAPGAPNPPSGLFASGTGNNVDLRWAAPRGGFAATSYLIEAGSAPGLSDLGRFPIGNVVTFSTVAPPGVYYVRVRAVNAQRCRRSLERDHRPALSVRLGHRRTTRVISRRGATILT